MNKKLTQQLLDDLLVLAFADSLNKYKEAGDPWGALIAGAALKGILDESSLSDKQIKNIIEPKVCKNPEQLDF